MAEKEIKITISASAKDAKQAFKEISEAAKKASDSIGGTGDAGKKAEKNIKGYSSALSGLASIARAAAQGALAKSIADVGLSAVKAASQMRQYEIAFQTMLKSADEGTRMLQDLQKFAAETPFDVPGVVEAAQQLLAFGFNAKEIIPTLRVLGDTAAGLGKSTAGVQQIAYALGQIRTSGTLKTQDMNQLTNAGISAWEILAQKAGKSVLEIKEMTEKGMIDSTKAVEVLTQGMTERFGGMMEKTAQEVQGLWNNIAESVGNAQATIGAFATDATNLKGILQVVSDAVGSMSDKLMQARNAGKDFGEAIKIAFPPELTIAVGALAAVIGVTLVGALGAAVAALGAFTGMSAPVIGVVAGLGAMIANAFNSKDDYEQKVIDELRELGDGANEYAEALQKAVDARKELASYSTYDSDYHDRIGEPEKPTDTGNVDLTNGAGKSSLKSYETQAKSITDAFNSTAESIRKTDDAHRRLRDAQEALELATLDGEAKKQAQYANTVSRLQEAQAIDNKATADKISYLKELLDLWTEAEAAGVDGSQKKVENLTAQIAKEQELLAVRKQITGLQMQTLEAGRAAEQAEEQKKIIEQVQDAWLNYGRSVASSVGQAVSSIVDGSKTTGQAMKEVLRSIISNIVTTAAEFAALCGMLMMFGVNPPGPIAAKMMFGVGVKEGTYKEGSLGARLALASGGQVRGAGTGTSDSIPAMLSNGEYVVKASAVRKIGVPALNAINAGRGFADGGVVDAGAYASQPITNNKNESRTANVSLNVSAMDAASFTDFLRNGGLDEIRQALFDTDRNFGGMAGVW